MAFNIWGNINIGQQVSKCQNVVMRLVEPYLGKGGSSLWTISSFVGEQVAYKENKSGWLHEQSEMGTPSLCAK
jgi:hypothetical protein